MKAKIFLLGMILSLPTFSLDIRSFQFTDSYRYATLDDSGLDGFKGPLVLTTSLSHTQDPLIETDSNFSIRYRSLVDSMTMGTFGGAYKVNDFFSMGAKGAFANVKANDESYSYLTDTEIYAKIGLIIGETFKFSMQPELYLPTGDLDSFTTRESIGGGLKFVLEKKLESVSFLLGAGYSHTEKNVSLGIDYTNLFLTQLGISFHLSPTLFLNLETNRYFTAESDYKQDQGEFYITMRGEPSEDFGIYGGVGVGGFTEIERDNLTAFLGLKFAFEDQKPKVAEATAPIVQEPPKVVQKPTTQPRIDTVKFETRQEEKKKLGEALTFENIYFENDMYDIKHSEQLKIDDFLKKISKYMDRIRLIVIEGYASRVGAPDHNQLLSLNRAIAVQNALILGGVKDELTTKVAYGDRAPQVEEEGKNRKVQFRLYILKESKYKKNNFKR